MTDVEQMFESNMLATDIELCPLELFESWVEDAKRRNQHVGDTPNPCAMTVATVDAQGRPDVRTVELRILGAGGPAFLTNLESEKAHQLAGNSALAATMTWPALNRAIRMRGHAIQLHRDTVRSNFNSRPWDARVAIWASAQSSKVQSREQLETCFADVARRYPDRGKTDDVPVPPFHGGYQIDCYQIEFWSARPNRMHSRLLYIRHRDGDLAGRDCWECEWRQP